MLDLVHDLLDLNVFLASEGSGCIFDPEQVLVGLQVDLPVGFLLLRHHQVALVPVVS